VTASESPNDAEASLVASCAVVADSDDGPRPIAIEPQPRASSPFLFVPCTRRRRHRRRRATSSSFHLEHLAQVDGLNADEFLDAQDLARRTAVDRDQDAREALALLA